MKRLAMIMLAATFSVPAVAQHDAHTPAPSEQNGPAKEAAAAVAQSDDDAPQEPSPPEQVVADPHAGHDVSHDVPPQQSADPHAGHDMAPGNPAAAPADPDAGHMMAAPAEPGGSAQEPGSEPDPHAGHAMPPKDAAEPHAGHDMTTAPETSPAADPHAGHDMAGAAAGALSPPAGAPPQEAFSGPEYAADLFYSPAQMAVSRSEMAREHGNLPAYRLTIDQLEARLGDGRDGYGWDAQFWYGRDIDKLWLRSEGGGEFGGSGAEVEFQALWSHAIDPWFDLQLGVRQDLQPGVDRTHLVAGIKGLAPYWFEVGGFAFVSTEGDVTLRFEGEYDLRLTQYLILQPRTELDLALQDIPELRTGSGLSAASIGARLRYELLPSSGPAVLAPYIGVQYERAFGDTADYHRSDGGATEGVSVLLGLRTWF